MCTNEVSCFDITLTDGCCIVNTITLLQCQLTSFNFIVIFSSQTRPVHKNICNCSTIDIDELKTEWTKHGLKTCGHMFAIFSHL